MSRSARWVLRPLPWQRFAVDPSDTALLIGYAQSATAGGPNFALDLIEVTRDERHVTVTLYERDAGGGEKLGRQSSAIAIELGEPLGVRDVVDGATGRPAPKVAVSEPDIDGLTIGALLEHAPALPLTRYWPPTPL